MRFLICISKLNRKYVLERSRNIFGKFKRSDSGWFNQEQQVSYKNICFYVEKGYIQMKTKYRVN